MISRTPGGAPGVFPTAFAEGALPSSDPVFASSPVPCSKNIPYPARIEVFPSPLGSQAKPILGAGLNKCPDMQLLGMPPFPHCTKPFRRRGSGLAGFRGIEVHDIDEGMEGLAQEGMSRSTPVEGSTAAVAARAGSKALASQL